MLNIAAEILHKSQKPVDGSTTSFVRTMFGNDINPKSKTYYNVHVLHIDKNISKLRCCVVAENELDLLDNNYIIMNCQNNVAQLLNRNIVNKGIELYKKSDCPVILADEIICLKPIK